MRDPSRELLMPQVADLMTAESTDWGALECIVVGGGPGGFTSLRIAGAIAKGVATAHGLELRAASSLALLAATAAIGVGTCVATLDAMRGEVYAARFSINAEGILAAEGIAERWPAGTIAERLPAGAVHFGFGASEGNNRVPHATGAGVLRRSGLAPLVDLASWEPDYGRLAEAQVKWEADHGRPLTSSA